MHVVFKYRITTSLGARPRLLTFSLDLFSKENQPFIDILSKAPEGENQPSTEVDLFISTEKIMVLNTDLKEIMMDHGLRTISYIADIGELVVIMARRRVLPQVENKYFLSPHTILDWKTNNWLKVSKFVQVFPFRESTENITNCRPGRKTR